MIARNAIALIAFSVFAFGACRAEAIPSTFDFTGNLGTVDPPGSTLIFFDQETGTRSVEASAWVTLDDPFGSIVGIFESRLHQNGDGLGANHLIDTDPEIDNFVGFDFLALDLGSPEWEPVSAELADAEGFCLVPGFFGGCIVSVPESDWHIHGSNTVAPGEGVPLTGPGFELLVSGTGNANVNIFSTDLFQYIYFSGEPGLGNVDDNFRVAGFVGVLNQIPEPVTIALFGAGLAGLGWVQRGRKRRID